MYHCICHSVGLVENLGIQVYMGIQIVVERAKLVDSDLVTIFFTIDPIKQVVSYL